MSDLLDFYKYRLGLTDYIEIYEFASQAQR